MARPYDILVLGATGYTGKLIVRYLYAHSQRALFSFAIGARSRRKLDHLVESVDLDDSVYRIEVDVTNYERLEEVVQRAKVVINAVGPYWWWGTNVVRACVRHRVHYVDLSGETPWLRDIITEFDYRATQNSTIIVPQCAICSIPSDIAVYLANKTLKSISPKSQIHNSTSAFEMQGWSGMSNGSRGTILTHLEEIPEAKVKAANNDYSLSPVKGKQISRFKLVYRMPYLPIVGAFSFVSPANTAIVQRTWGLFELEAHHPSNEDMIHYARRHRYGSEFYYEEFTAMSSSITALFSSLVIMLVFTCLALFRPARWLLKLLPSQSDREPSNELSTLREIEKGSLTLTNITSSTDSPPIVIKTTIYGRGDPGYPLSAAMASEAALSLLLSYEDLPALGRRGGVLTPMTALGDVLIDRLRMSGRFELDSRRLENIGNKKTE